MRNEKKDWDLLVLTVGNAQQKTSRNVSFIPSPVGSLGRFGYCPTGTTAGESALPALYCVRFPPCRTSRKRS